jgi:hypothetical protein
MAPDPTPHVPGNMTVSFLFGWQGLVTLLVVVIVVGLVFLAISAARSTRDTRSEWQVYLESRSRVPAIGEPHEEAAGEETG